MPLTLLIIAVRRMHVIHDPSLWPNQGSKKVSSSRPGQVDFCTGQVTFPTHLPNGQGCEQAACKLSLNNN